MDAYVDGSGDEGFSFGRPEIHVATHSESSRFYVVAVVLVIHLEPIKPRLDELKGQFSMDPSTELKFSSLSPKQRYATLAAMDCFDFEVHAIVVEKRRVTSPSLRQDGIKFRQFFCKQILATERTPLSNSGVVIDRQDGNAANEAAFKEYLSRELRVRPQAGSRISSIELAESHEDYMLQAADLCAGAIRWRYERRSPEYHRFGLRPNQKRVAIPVITLVARRDCFCVAYPAQAPD